MFYLLIFEPFNPDIGVEFWGYSDMNSVLDTIRDLVRIYNLLDQIERIFDRIHIFKVKYGKPIKSLELPPSNIVKYNMIHKKFSHDAHDEYVAKFPDLDGPENTNYLCFNCNIVYQKSKICKACQSNTNSIL